MCCFTVPSSLECPSTRVVGIENDNITLRCHAKGNPRPQIYWTGVGGHSILARGNVFSLSNVKRTTIKKYLITAANGVKENASATIDLEIQCKHITRVYIFI